MKLLHTTLLLAISFFFALRIFYWNKRSALVTNKKYASIIDFSSKPVTDLGVNPKKKEKRQRRCKTIRGETVKQLSAVFMGNSRVGKGSELSPGNVTEFINSFSPAFPKIGDYEQIIDTLEAIVKALKAHNSNGGDSYWIGGNALTEIGKKRHQLHCWQDAIDIYVDRAKAQWPTIQTALNPFLGKLKPPFEAKFMTDENLDKGLGIYVSKRNTDLVEGQLHGKVSVYLYFYDIVNDSKEINIQLMDRVVSIPYNCIFPLKKSRFEHVEVQIPQNIESTLLSFDGPQWRHMCNGRTFTRSSLRNATSNFQILCNESSLIEDYAFVSVPHPPPGSIKRDVGSKNREEEQNKVVKMLHEENKDLTTKLLKLRHALNNGRKKSNSDAKTGLQTGKSFTADPTLSWDHMKKLFDSNSDGLLSIHELKLSGLTHEELFSRHGYSTNMIESFDSKSWETFALQTQLYRRKLKEASDAARAVYKARYNPKIDPWYRLYYRCLGYAPKFWVLQGRSADECIHTCYAESRDGGYTFEKPPLRNHAANWNGPDIQSRKTDPQKTRQMPIAELKEKFPNSIGGLYPNEMVWKPCVKDTAQYEGREDANIMLKGGYVFTPFKDLQANVPASERYRAVVTLVAHGGDETFRSFVSEDAVKWRLHDPLFGGDRYVLTKARNDVGHALDGQNIIFFDYRVNKYVAFIRMVKSWSHRSFGHAVSDNWLQWPNKNWQYATIKPPFSAREGIYSASVNICPTKTCGHVTLALVTRVHAGSNTLPKEFCGSVPNCENLRTDIQLLMSRDLPNNQRSMVWDRAKDSSTESLFTLGVRTSLIDPDGEKSMDDHRRDFSIQGLIDKPTFNEWWFYVAERTKCSTSTNPGISENDVLYEPNLWENIKANNRCSSARVIRYSIPRHRIAYMACKDGVDTCTILTRPLIINLNEGEGPDGRMVKTGNLLLNYASVNAFGRLQVEVHPCNDCEEKYKPPKAPFQKVKLSKKSSWHSGDSTSQVAVWGKSMLSLATLLGAIRKSTDKDQIAIRLEFTLSGGARLYGIAFENELEKTTSKKSGDKGAERSKSHTYTKDPEPPAPYYIGDRTEMMITGFLWQKGLNNIVHKTVKAKKENVAMDTIEPWENDQRTSMLAYSSVLAEAPGTQSKNAQLDHFQ
jgi:hypothetical protein